MGEQAAGTPAFSTAPAWAGTLQGEEGGDRERSVKPQASHSQPSLVRGGRGSRNPTLGGLVQRLLGDSVLGESTDYILILALLLQLLKPQSGDAPSRGSGGGLGGGATPASSRSQDTLGFRVPHRTCCPSKASLGHPSPPPPILLLFALLALRPSGQSREEGGLVKNPELDFLPVQVYQACWASLLSPSPLLLPTIGPSLSLAS